MLLVALKMHNRWVTYEKYTFRLLKASLLSSFTSVTQLYPLYTHRQYTRRIHNTYNIRTNTWHPCRQHSRTNTWHTQRQPITTCTQHIQLAHNYLKHPHVTRTTHEQHIKLRSNTCQTYRRASQHIQNTYNIRTNTWHTNTYLKHPQATLTTHTS